MNEPPGPAFSPQRVLVASANPLFGRGLEHLVHQRWQHTATRLTSSMSETLTALQTWQPDLVIVDYDDHTIERTTFLNQFVTGEHPMQVMLVSLQANGHAVIYDRRSLTPDQMEDWLTAPPAATQPFSPLQES